MVGGHENVNEDICECLRREVFMEDVRSRLNVDILVFSGHHFHGLS